MHWGHSHMSEEPLEQHRLSPETFYQNHTEDHYNGQTHQPKEGADIHVECPKPPIERSKQEMQDMSSTFGQVGMELTPQCLGVSRAHHLVLLIGHWWSSERMVVQTLKSIASANEWMPHWMSGSLSAPGTHSRINAWALAKKANFNPAQKTRERGSIWPLMSPWELKGWHGNPITNVQLSVPSKWDSSRGRSGESKSRCKTCPCEWWASKVQASPLWSTQSRGFPPRNEAAMPMEPVPAASSTKSGQKAKGRGVEKAREASTNSKSVVECELTCNPNAVKREQMPLLRPESVQTACCATSKSRMRPSPKSSFHSNTPS